MDTIAHRFDKDGYLVRFVGTIHLPAVYASEENFMAFHDQFHPRHLGGSMVLRPHSPEGHPPLELLGRSAESCLDVWVACREENPGKGAALPVSVLNRWRDQTQALRRDELMVIPPQPRRALSP